MLCSVTMILHTLLIGHTVAILHIGVVAPLAEVFGYNLCVNKGAPTESLCHAFAFPALPFLGGEGGDADRARKTFVFHFP